VIQLSLGRDSLIVAPEHGAAIVGWISGTTHLLRRPSPEAVLLGLPGAMGCFPLVPYCNRIAHRRFTWGNQAYDLAANFGGHAHAIHGIGWQRPWQMEELSTTAVTLLLRHDTPDPSWPFAFEARLRYRLTDQGLTIQIEAVNRHAAAAPMGIGAHPYFSRDLGAAIRFQADGVWTNNESLPEKHGPIPPRWDHTESRSVTDQPLDNCFTGWRGAAALPGLRIEADPVFGNLQIFTPEGKNFFCVEPVSHVPDAINRQGLAVGGAMTVLAPGEALSGSMIFARDADVRS
jgi:aldose 1-epimerase